jgi:hypothetical protein
MPNDIMLIIIRQIKSMPKHFRAKEELCRKTVMPNDVMPNEVCQLILCVNVLCNLKESRLEVSHLEDHVLVAVAEGGAEGVGGVGGGGAVEHDGSLAHAQRARHHLPLAVRRDAHRAHAFY